MPKERTCQNCEIGTMCIFEIIAARLWDSTRQYECEPTLKTYDSVCPFWKKEKKVK